MKGIFVKKFSCLNIFWLTVDANIINYEQIFKIVLSKIIWEYYMVLV